MADGHLAVGPATEDELRVAEPRARKPPGSGHLARAEHALVGLARLDLEELPDRRPEVLELVDRPLPQVGVVLEREPARLVEPLAVARDRRGRDPLRARRPNDRGNHGADATRADVVAKTRTLRGHTWYRPSAARGLERRGRVARCGGGSPGHNPGSPKRAGVGSPSAVAMPVSTSWIATSELCRGSQPSSSRARLVSMVGTESPMSSQPGGVGWSRSRQLAAMAPPATAGGIGSTRAPNAFASVWASSTGSAATLKAPRASPTTASLYASATSRVWTAWNRNPPMSGTTARAPRRTSARGINGPRK